MQRAARSEGEISVAVSRFGQDTVMLKLAKGTKVGDALEKEGIELESNEKIFVAGEEATRNDILEDGDVLSIVTPKQAGAN